MIKSSVPNPVIPGSGIASPSLVSLIACNKFVLALPFERQAKEFKRMGINIPKQNMANWIIHVATKHLKSLYDLLQIELLKNDINHADETTCQVINEKNRKAKQKSYMWVYSSGKYAVNPVILFDYQKTRHGAHPLEFLKDFIGFLNADGYPGYKKLEKYNKIILIGCYSHVRSKFMDAYKALNNNEKSGSIAEIGLIYCNKLFELERKYDELKLTPDERKQKRELESKPIAEAFFKWAESVLPGTISKSKIGRAITYTVNQKEWLMNIYLDGRLEISNNRAERSVRPFAIGRNNWMFMYSENGAESSSILYSIVLTAEANGLVPFMYLNYLFQELPNLQTSKKQLSDFLPWNLEVQKICKIPSTTTSGS